MRDELLVLVDGEGVAHRVHQDPVELRALHPGHRQLVDVREVAFAELAIPVDLELTVGDLAVPGELFGIAQILAIRDGEVLLGVEVDALMTAGDAAENYPTSPASGSPTES